MYLFMLFLKILLMYLYILAQVAFDILMLQLSLFLFFKKKQMAFQQSKRAFSFRSIMVALRICFIFPLTVSIFQGWVMSCDFMENWVLPGDPLD